MADTAAALVIQLSADFKDFEKQMKKATGVFDANGRAIEKRQAALRKNLSNWSIDFTGLSGLKSALLGLTAVGIVGGIGDIIKKSLDAASAIGDVARQAGVSVEFLQKLRFAASQSGASFDVLDEGLTVLNRNFGEFVNTGAGRAAAAFKQLGLDKLINSGQVRDTEQAFDAIVARINKVGSESQKASLAAKLFGQEAGPKLLQTLEQGNAGLAALEAQAVSLGVVLSTQTVQGAKEANDKLDALFKVMKAEGISAVASQAKEIANLADQITKGLPNLIAWVEHWADYFGLIKESPIAKFTYELSQAQAQLDKLTGQKQSQTLHFPGVDAQFDLEIAAAKAARDKAKNALSIATADQQISSYLHPTPATKPPPKVTVPPTDAEKNAAAQAARAAAQAKARTTLDADTAAAVILASQDSLSVQLLKGSADYYSALQKQIDDELAAKTTAANDEAAVQIASLDKQKLTAKQYGDAVANINKAAQDKITADTIDAQQKRDEISPNGQILRQALEDGQTQILQYEQQTGALGLATAALAKYNYVQDQYNKYREAGIPLTQTAIEQISKEGDAVAAAAQSNKEASDIMSANVQVADNLREGLVDIGVTAITQASNFKQAVGQMLLSLAQLIVKLELTKVAQDALGESGTPLTGFLGSLFGSGSSNLSGVTAASLAGPGGGIIGFAGGGYTGPGGKNQPAGIVHKGEYVFDQEAVKRIGVGNLAVMQRGYANGGPVGFSVPAIPSVSPRSGGSGAVIVNNYDLSGAVVTDELFARVSRVADKRAAAQLAQYDKALPTKVARLRENPRVR